MRIMSKLSKIINAIFIFILIYCIININSSSKVLAASTDNIEESVIMQISSTSLYDKDALDKFTQDIDNYKTTPEDNQDVVNIINTVLGIIIAIGSIMAVILVAMIGFYAVLGSAEEMAMKKEQLVGWLVGAVIMVSGSAIVRLIYNVVIDW